MARLDLKPPALDRGCRVARQMTAARQTRPERCVGEPLKARLQPGVRDHVLVEAQLAARADHAVQLRERRVLVGHRAEHERDDPRIEGLPLIWEATRATVYHGDRDRRLRCRALRTLAQVALGLDGDHPTD